MSDVRFGSKADLCSAKWHVRFTRESDIKYGIVKSLFWPRAGIVLIDNFIGVRHTVPSRQEDAGAQSWIARQ